MGDDELDELRRRKLAELQQQAAGEEARNARDAEARGQKDMILRQILEPEARERLERVRIARPEVAQSLEDQLVVLYQQGRIRGKINDELLRDFLARVAPKQRDIKIERR
ncbi:MAG: DNA-binding protein [Thermoplasmatota archaeon]